MSLPPNAEAGAVTEDTVDNTLLESLFYNEMMLMEESPSLLVNVLSADGKPVDPSTLGNSSNPPESRSADDPKNVPSLTASSTLDFTDEAKREKLIFQFTTLANRLGISLPSEVTRAFQTPENAHTPIDVDVATVPRKRESTPSEASGSKRRSKKRPRLVDCERRLASLKAENALLKRHVDRRAGSTQKLVKEQRAAELHMRELVNSRSSDASLQAAVQSFTDLYSDYGKHRHEELSFHLDQLQLLANPTNVTKMGLWTLQQEGNPIAGILQRELGISLAQGKKIMEQKQKIRTLSDNMKECWALLSKLSELCTQKTSIFNDRMSKCREILTPRQVVRLIIWVDDHTETLAQVCPGWGSEQLRSKGSVKG